MLNLGNANWSEVTYQQTNNNMLATKKIT